MIQVENWERIRRAYHIEQKSVGAIMRETGQAYRTVKRIIESRTPGKYALKQGRRAPVLGSYKEQIREWLRQNGDLPAKQRYTASRIYHLLCEKGYGGAESTVRHYVSVVRKGQKKVEVYLPLAFEPGQDGQVEWGEADVILNGQQVTVQLFVIRLGYSRRTWVMAFPSQKQEAFFLGHVEAFHHFGGVPRRLTYDNLTTAVRKILQGKDRQEQERFLTFRGFYLFDSHFCTPGEGHEKGSVEHGVGYVRRQYLVPLPQVASYQELNDYLRRRCDEDDERQVHGQPATIGAMWQTERSHLRCPARIMIVAVRSKWY
jgi:transposase